jgi:hypothetical protein
MEGRLKIADLMCPGDALVDVMLKYAENGWRITADTSGMARFTPNALRTWIVGLGHRF